MFFIDEPICILASVTTMGEGLAAAFSCAAAEATRVRLSGGNADELTPHLSKFIRSFRRVLSVHNVAVLSFALCSPRQD